MKAKEIRDHRSSPGMEGFRDFRHEQAFFLGEIAAQLADLNEREDGKRPILMYNPELLRALDELASAIADAHRRYEAGDLLALKSNMLAATYRQAIDVIEKAKGRP